MLLITGAKGGDWFVFLEKDGEKLEGLVRRIPPLKAKEIEVRHLGRVRKRTIGKGGVEVTHDVEKNEAVILEKADYALVKLRGGWQLPTLDDDGQPLIPAIESNGSGFVTLDDHWHDPKVRAQAFAAYPAMALWAVEKASAQEVAAQEDEGKDETS